MELKKRLQASYGESKDNVVQQKNPKAKKRSIKMSSTPDKKFSYEVIYPCDCGIKYHRVCIREKIVAAMQKRCSKCLRTYSVGYTECYAIFNKKRPNYLGYMLVQELLFWLSIIAFSEVIRQIFLYAWDQNKPRLQAQWFVIIMTLCTATSLLSVVIYILRLRYIYCFREIEDIIVFDRSQRQELDFDSPAVLGIFFADNQNYEAQQKYYKVSIQDRFRKRFNGLLGNPLQRIRALVQNILNSQVITN